MRDENPLLHRARQVLHDAKMLLHRAKAFLHDVTRVVHDVKAGGKVAFSRMRLIGEETKAGAAAMGDAILARM